MMIGDQHVDAPCVGGRDTFDAGDAVIDGDEQLRRTLRGKRHDFCGQSIAELEAIGHDEVDARPQRAQAAYGDRAGGGAVRIVVGDDENALLQRDGLGEARGGRFDAAQPREWWQRAQRMVEFGRRANAACRVGAGQHRRDPGRGEGFRHRWLRGASNDRHAHASSSAAGMVNGGAAQRSRTRVIHGGCCARHT